MGNKGENGVATLSTFKAAEELAVSAATILQWIQDGKIQATRAPNGRYRVTPEEVERVRTERHPPDRLHGADAAAFLRVSAKTLARFVAEGRLHPRKIEGFLSPHGVYWYPKAELIQLNFDLDTGAVGRRAVRTANLAQNKEWSRLRDEGWLTVAEITEQFGVSRQRIFQLCGGKQLRYTKIPGKRMLVESGGVRARYARRG